VDWRANEKLAGRPEYVYQSQRDGEWTRVTADVQAPERATTALLQLYSLTAPQGTVWWGPQWIQPDLPVIYVHAFGGPTKFYMGMGEAEILWLVDEMKARFFVDPDRVYIMGHSMGRRRNLPRGAAPSGSVWRHRSGRSGDVGANRTGAEMDGSQIAIQSVPKLYANARNVDGFFKNAGAGLQRQNTEFGDGIVAQRGFAESFSTTDVFPECRTASAISIRSQILFLR
jgi:hypothetical protein